jgi:hypothetical protein
VSVGLAGGEVLAELVYVYPESSASIQANLVAVDGQPVGAEGISEGVEGAAQGSAAPRAVGLGPQEVDEGITAVGLACDGEIGDKGDSLAPVEPHRHAVALDARRPEQIQSKGGLHNTSLCSVYSKAHEKSIGELRLLRVLDSGVRMPLVAKGDEADPRI